MNRKTKKVKRKACEKARQYEQNLQEPQGMQKKVPGQQQTILVCKNQLVLNRLKEINFPQLLGFKDAKVDYQGDQIMIFSKKRELNKLKPEIEDWIQKLEKQLNIEGLDFSKKEIKYVQKNLSTIIEDFQKKKNIKISYQSSQQQNQKLIKSLATSLSFEGKELQIAYADISQIECDAIVNSCNERFSGDPDDLSGVAKSISEMAGNSYHFFLSLYTSQFQLLKAGETITYKMPAGNHIKFIINVATPIYSNGKQLTKDLEEIKKNIQAIFQEANKLQIQSLAIPIIGGGACGYSFSQASEVVLREVINILFSNQNQIKTVIVTELMDSKINELQDSLKQLLSPPKQQKICYNQWQWEDNSTFKDYDDENINLQIQETYEEYLKTGEEQTCLLKFPFSKQPGTHVVDVENSKLYDISLRQEVSYQVFTINNSLRYFINGSRVSDALNEYLILQSSNNVKKFTIFYKNHEVVINNQEMYQINLQTDYTRKIQFYKKQNINKAQVSKQMVLNGKKFVLKDFQYRKFSIVKKEDQQLFIESLGKQISKQIKDILRKELDKNIITLEVKVPNMLQEELQDFEEFLLQNTLTLDGSIRQGKVIRIKLFSKKDKKIRKHIEQIQLRNIQYPPDWEYQSDNFLKVHLPTYSREYQLISNLYKQTEQGTISEINRIQNKILWENYIQEKNKLIKQYNQQGYQLSKIEEERYLWHGVSGEHPKVIYEGLKEAFDQTYSKIGLWGPGIYFAKNASYSRDYSYTLTVKDNGIINAGKKVFLCCLVTTGKVEVRQQDNTIKRPTQGYDCVSGITQGSDVFVLYSMDIRRAYPAYEIIYE